ncbi:MAG: tRNA (adenosine(37)-N6)-threonylcarbamoyltransferase complex dimerization subunit type 1 TsaB [Bacilli bacterium]
MIGLFLNTSSNYLSLCLYKNTTILTSIYKKLDKDLSKETLFLIENMLKEVGLTPKDIDEIVCVRGPGSFTGLRVGVAIAKTFAYFLNKKLYSISSLELMSLSSKGDIKVPIIDARRGFVYGAIYDKNNNSLLEESYISLEELKKIVNTYDGEKVFVSNDSFEFQTSRVKPNFESIITSKFKKEENPMTFVPNYLKKTEAEENLHDYKA